MDWEREKGTNDREKKINIIFKPAEFTKYVRLNECTAEWSECKKRFRSEREKQFSIPNADFWIFFAIFFTISFFLLMFCIFLHCLQYFCCCLVWIEFIWNISNKELVLKMHHPCDLAIKVGATKWVWWWSFAQVTVEQMTVSFIAKYETIVYSAMACAIFFSSRMQSYAINISQPNRWLVIAGALFFGSFGMRFFTIIGIVFCYRHHHCRHSR